MRGITKEPWLIYIYGVPGVGKSYYAKDVPGGAVFMNIENGLKYIDCVKTPHLKSYDDLKSWTMKAAGDSFGTVVFDTVDALERLLTKKILEENPGKESLADFGYGSGFKLLMARWNMMVSMFEYLMDKGKNVLLLGHERDQKFQDPASDSYDRYQPSLYKDAVELLVGRSDAVLFARWETILKKRDGKKDDMAPKRGVGTNRRILQTQETPAWIAKNRFSLPEQLEMQGPELFELISNVGETSK
jgi:hypothetical protein